MQRNLVCPMCEQPMTEVVAGTLQFDQCRCGCLWFDRGEIDRYVRAQFAGKPARLEAVPLLRRSGEPRNCPRCRQPTLAPFHLRAVPMRRCEACHGHLFDRDTAIAMAVESGTRSGKGGEPAGSFGLAALEPFDWVGQLIVALIEGL